MSVLAALFVFIILVVKHLFEYLFEERKRL